MARIITLLQIALLSAFFSSFSFKSFAQSTSYSFFVAGHVYGAPGVNNNGMHPPFKALFPFFQADSTMQLGVLTGDIVSPNPIAQDWDEIDADVAALGLPVYFTVGNHDMENRPLFESRYGRTYSAFVENNDLFLILDTDLDHWNIVGEQMNFVQNTLDSLGTTVDNIFVFVHHLIWVPGNPKYKEVAPNSFASMGASVNFWSEVEPLFRSIGTRTIFFAGDIGAAYWSSDFMYDSYDNITLIASGMGETDGENFVIVRKSENKEVTVDLFCIEPNPTTCFGSLTEYRISEINPYLYPNPTNNNLQIIGVPSEVPIDIALYDPMGKIIASKTFAPYETRSFTTSEVAPGYYLVEIGFQGETTRLWFQKL